MVAKPHKNNASRILAQIPLRMHVHHVLSYKHYKNRTLFCSLCDKPTNSAKQNGGTWEDGGHGIVCISSLQEYELVRFVVLSNKRSRRPQRETNPPVQKAPRITSRVYLSSGGGIVTRQSTRLLHRLLTDQRSIYLQTDYIGT